MQLKYNNNFVAIFLLVLFGILSTNCFNMEGWVFIMRRTHWLIFAFSFIIISLSNITLFKSSIKNFSIYIKYLLLCPIITSFSTLISGGSFTDEFLSDVTVSSYLLLIPIFTRFEIKEETIIKSLTIIGILSIVIVVYEQYNPNGEYSIFGTRLALLFNSDYSDSLNSGEVGSRNNINKYNVGYSLGCLFLCLFYYNQFILKRKKVYFFLWVAFCIGLYLYLTRQYMISICATLLLSTFMFKGYTHKIYSFFFIIVFFLLLFSYWDVLFKVLKDDYINDTWTTDIRFECINVFLTKMWNNPISAIGGFGHATHYEMLERINDHHIADIGFIGQSYYYGFFFTIFYFYFIYIVLIRYRKQLPLYIKLYVIATGLISIFIFPYINKISYFIWSCMIYIMKLYIDENYELTIEQKRT